MSESEAEVQVGRTVAYKGKTKLTTDCIYTVWKSKQCSSHHERIWGRTKELERTLILHCNKCIQDSMGMTKLRASWQKWKWEEHESVLDQVSAIWGAPPRVSGAGELGEEMWTSAPSGNVFSLFFPPQALSKSTQQDRYLSLVYIQCTLGSVLWWGTMFTSHEAGGTLPWQFASPDC